MKKLIDSEGKEIEGKYKKDFLKLKNGIDKLMDNMPATTCVDVLSTCLITFCLEVGLNKEVIMELLGKGYDLYKEAIDVMKEANAKLEK
jgi:hypothetical protein